MAKKLDDAWDKHSQALEIFVAGLRRSRATKIGDSVLRDQAKELVQAYFREVRPELEAVGFTKDALDDLDSQHKQLLGLATGRNLRIKYLKRARAMQTVAKKTAIERELQLGSRKIPPAIALTRTETLILQSLIRMNLVSAALSYEQGVRDLSAPNRLSQRGVAHELRETLREVLDNLAPDTDVQTAVNFKLEPGQKKPTQKQKALHILRSRGISKTAVQAPSGVIEIIEQLTAALARDVYSRSSAAAHSAATLAEVQKMKMYVDAVLVELLAILG